MNQCGDRREKLYLANREETIVPILLHFVFKFGARRSRLLCRSTRVYSPCVLWHPRLLQQTPNLQPKYIIVRVMSQSKHCIWSRNYTLKGYDTITQLTEPPNEIIRITKLKKQIRFRTIWKSIHVIKIKHNSYKNPQKSLSKYLKLTKQ